MELKGLKQLQYVKCMGNPSDSLVKKSLFDRRAFLTATGAMMAASAGVCPVWFQ